MDTNFRILVHGRNLDVDALSGVVGALVTKLWRRGGLYKNSGLELSMGDGAAMSWGEQLQVVASYIERHEALLSTASSFPGVEKFILGLYWRMERDPNVVGCAIVLTKGVLRRAIGVGLTPVTYLHFVHPSDARS